MSEVIFVPIRPNRIFDVDVFADGAHVGYIACCVYASDKARPFTIMDNHGILKAQDLTYGEALDLARQKWAQAPEQHIPRKETAHADGN